MTRFSLSTAVLGLVVALSPLVATAQSDPGGGVEVLRPVTAAYTVEFGSSHLADTYLSPIKYSGWTATLRYDRMQAMKFNPENWVMQLDFSADVERTRNLARNATMWYFGVDFNWAMMRRFRVLPRLTVGVGGQAEADLGCLYSERNSNNPASAKCALTVGAAAYAAYNMKLGGLPVTFSYRGSLPVVGAFFSPDYGELYYEIYLGNHNGLAHCAWWGNYFKLENSLTADLHFGGTSLRLGYRGVIGSTKVNHLVSRHFTHCAVIGISGEWLSFNPRRKPAAKTRVISALFDYK